MSDPRIISLDIETYGAFDWLPPQTVFTPQRSLTVDRIPLHSLIQTVAITLPTYDPRQPNQPWDASLLSQLEPGDTLTFEWSNPKHRKTLYAFLAHADTILGMNLLFDFGYLRFVDPVCRQLLNGRHTVIDLSYVNFIENPSRPERSLKAIGHALQTHTYERTAKDRFSTIAEGLDYNAQDTHNTIVNISHLARRITESPTHHKDDPRLSPYCINFYSDTIWSCVGLTEAGIPMDRSALRDFALTLHDKTTSIEETLELRHSLLAAGPGSQKSKADFLSSIIETIDSSSTWTESNGRSIINHPLIELTEKKKEISFNEANLNLFAPLLPPNHPHAEALKLLREHTHAQKLLGTYCYPLLWGKRADTTKQHSVLVPQFPSHTHPLPEDEPCQQSQTHKIPAPSTSPSSPTSPIQHSSPSQPQLSTSSSGSHSTSQTTPTSAMPSKTHASTPTTTTTTLAPIPQTTLASHRNPDVFLSHPSWFITPSPFKDGGGSEGGTQQGRITCKNHSAQTDPPPIQSLRRSRWKRGVLVSMDLSQIELRVAALTSGEPSLVEAYLQGWDLHGRRACSIWPPTELASRYPDIPDLPIDKWKTIEGFNDRERQVGKTVNFADLFRAMGATMQRSVLEAMGELFPLAFFDAIASNRINDRPILYEWQERIIHEARTTGRVTLPFTGQSRLFMGGSKYDVNEIVNFPIQTTAGNTMLRIQANLHATLSKHNSRILMYLNVYDALYFDCADARSAHLLTTEIIPTVINHVATQDYWAHLSDHYNRHVPLIADTSIKEPTDAS